MHVHPASIPSQTHPVLCINGVNILWFLFQAQIHHWGLPEQNCLCQSLLLRSRAQPQGSDTARLFKLHSLSSSLTEFAPAKSKSWTANIPQKGSWLTGDQVISSLAYTLIREDVLFPPFCPVLVRIRGPDPSLSPEHVCKINPCVSQGLMGERLDGLTQRCRIKSQIPWSPTQYIPFFLSPLTKGFGKTSPHREHSADEEDKESSGLWRQGKHYRDFVGAFLFPCKDIIPNVVICGLAPTSFLLSDCCRVSLDSDQFSWNQNTAEGVWKSLSIFNTPETQLGMLQIDQGN